MISLRNLTILLSCCFVLTSSPAKADAALCPAPDNSKPDLDYYKERARALAAEKLWAEAESCLDEAETLAPHNRDIDYQRARYKAFENNHDDAREIVEAWPADDRESREIRGDLAWYRGDINESEKWYRLAADDDAPVSTWKSWLKAVRAKKTAAYPKAVDEALTHYPDDPDLLALKKQFHEKSDSKAAPHKLKRTKPTKKPDPERPAYRASLGGTYIRETQNQHLYGVDVDAAVISHKKSFLLGASSLERDYGDATFTDHPLRASFGIGYLSEQPSFLLSQESTLTIGGTPNAVFTPKRFITYRHELFFTNTFSMSGEIGAKWYPTLYARTANLGLTYFHELFRYQARIYNTHAQSNDFAGYLGIAYQEWIWVPELYVTGGRDAASRPYILDNQNASFLAVGTSLTYRYSPRWAVRGIFEQRWESGFRQQTFTAVLLWNDR